MPEDIRVDRIVDARGAACPGPLMEFIKAFRNAKVGETIAVLSTDPGSTKDIPMWVKKAGQELVAINQKEGYVEIIVKKVK